MSNQQYEQNKQAILAFMQEFLEERQLQLARDYRLDLPGNYEDRWGNLENVPLYHRLDQINQAACGLIDAAPGSEKWEEVHAATQKVLELLFFQPGLDASYEVPDTFWNDTSFGRMVRDAHIWCEGDKLITQAQAAELCGKSIQSISNWIAAGKLTVYSDDGSSHKPGGRLVSENQVINLCKIAS